VAVEAVPEIVRTHGKRAWTADRATRIIFKQIAGDFVEQKDIN